MPTIYREGPYRFFSIAARKHACMCMYSQPAGPASFGWNPSSRLLMYTYFLSRI